MSLLKEAAYKALDAVTLGRGVSRVIGGETIKFPARWSRYYEADYEPETFKFFSENVRPGQTVLDIGGHIGLFAVVNARRVGPAGKVFSFEPTPFTRSVLTEVVELNSCSDIVEVRGEAVSSRRGETVFFDTGNAISNANSLVKTEMSRTEIPITLVSVDEFVKEKDLKVDCLKIDVEGAELDVLIGARETFLGHRPVARLGLHPPFIKQNGQSLEDIWNVLNEYKVNVVFDGKAAEKHWFCTQPELFDVNLLPVESDVNARK
ncbi:MAG: FkbM family methyltransferase [Pyrinomonadaceae bacterium]